MERIEWKCDECGFPVEDGDGYIEMAGADRQRYEDDLKAWQEKNPGPMYGGAALLDHPEPAEWHVWHKTCDPDPDAGSYWFDVHRIRTVEAVLHWTLHLMEKDWLGATDWVSFVHSRVGPRES